MIGYGMAKAAIHQLVKSLADSAKSGLPEGTFAAAILPITLDTPMNRKWMPKAGSKSHQFGTWKIARDFWYLNHCRSDAEMGPVNQGSSF